MNRAAVAPFSIGRVRAGLLAYSIGKAISAPLSLLLILMLAALLPREEYAGYIAAAAVLEIGVVLGSFGVEWVMQTAIAGILVHGNRRQLQRAVRCLGCLPFITYAGLATVFWFHADLVSHALGRVASADLLRLYAVVLAIEGPTRVLRDSLMSIMLLQRIAQVSLVVRVVLVFVLVGAAHGIGAPLTAADIARFEIAAALIALTITLLALRGHLSQPSGAAGGEASIGRWVGWQSVRFAAHAYTSVVLMLLVGTDVMTALVARCLGAEATAAFGLMVRLLEMARRYLPADLFWGVVRPAAIGRYEAGARNPRLLMLDCNRMIDANLLAVGLAMALTMSIGDVLVHQASRGRVEGAALLLALLPLLASHSVRRAIELFAYTRGHSARFAQAALACLMGPPLAVVLMRLTGLPHAAAWSVLAADLLFIGLAVRALRSVREPLHFNLDRWCRIAAVTVLAGGAGLAVRHAWPTGSGVLTGGLATVSVMLAALPLLGLVAQGDWMRLGSLLRARSGS